MLTDTHAHLYWDSFKDDLVEVLKRAKDSNISTIFNVGTDVKTSQEALSQLPKLEESEIKAYSTIGIHPHEAYKYEDPKKLAEDINSLEKIYLENPKKVIGVGECGLDFFFKGNSDYNPTHLSENQLKVLQIRLLKSQIDLAKKLNLPIIVHVRDDRSNNPDNSDCWEKAIEMTKDWKGIYHCYSGLSHNTQYIIQSTSFLISFAAPITYPKNDYLRQIAKDLPLERICLETDSPFLPPQSKRGQRNEPKTVKEIATLIAELKNLTLEKISTQTTLNIKTLFNLDLQ